MNEIIKGILKENFITNDENNLSYAIEYVINSMNENNFEEYESDFLKAILKGDKIRFYENAIQELYYENCSNGDFTEYLEQQIDFYKAGTEELTEENKELKEELKQFKDILNAVGVTEDGKIVRIPTQEEAKEIEQSFKNIGLNFNLTPYKGEQLEELKEKNKQLEEELKQIKEKLSLERKEKLIYKNEFQKLKQGTEDAEPVKKKAGRPKKKK